MDAPQLVARAMAATGDKSIRAFATRLGVSHAAVYHWMEGNNVPTFEQAAEMAEMAGLPVIQTAAKVRLDSKDGAKHRALLRRLSQAAAVALCAVAPAITAALSTAYGIGFRGMPIMSRRATRPTLLA